MPLIYSVICAISGMDVFNYNKNGSDVWFHLLAGLGCDYLVGVS